MQAQGAIAMKMIKPAFLGTLMVPAFMFAAGSVSAQETMGAEATYLTTAPEKHVPC
jgi:hypothetical protein